MGEPRSACTSWYLLHWEPHPDWGDSNLCCTYEMLEDEDFLDPESGQALLRADLVGKKMEMYWSKGVGWLTGNITSFDADSEMHQIVFQDGDAREVDLKGSKRKWQLKGWKEVRPEDLG